MWYNNVLLRTLLSEGESPPPDVVPDVITEKDLKKPPRVNIGYYPAVGCVVFVGFKSTNQLCLL